jgi:hypothetical protein
MIRPPRPTIDSIAARKHRAADITLSGSQLRRAESQHSPFAFAQGCLSSDFTDQRNKRDANQKAKTPEAAREPIFGSGQATHRAFFEMCLFLRQYCETPNR